jgi:hypothetical protein
VYDPKQKGLGAKRPLRAALGEDAMIERVEKIDSRCPCGQPLMAIIFHRKRLQKADPPANLLKKDRFIRSTLVKIGWRNPETGERKYVKCCPTCDRDFSQLTADQVREGVWTS